MAVLLLGWFMFLLAFLIFLQTGENGYFKQKRIGRNRKVFKIIKIRTIKFTFDSQKTNGQTNLFHEDLRQTKFQQFLRRTKIDELPQLWNVLWGDMSFVGPRPDVPGFADTLEGEDRILLQLRPGITGPASMAFKNEEEILNQQSNPDQYNREILWPKKVRINLVSVALRYKSNNFN